MGFYVELHCDGPNCPHGAGEEGFQGSHKAKIAAEARRHGWRKIAGRWLCPGCVANPSRQDTSPSSKDETI